MTGDLNADALATLAEELASVAKLLVTEPALAKHLAEPTDESAPKVRLVDSLLSGKVGDTTLGILRTAVSQRWSTESNLVDGIEHTARLALLKRAEVAHQVDEVEDQLFRFGRVLDAEPRLAALLSDYTTPAEGRIALLDKVLDGSGVNGTAAALLSQTVELLRGERADEAVIDLAELAVSRRGEVVAHVTAAAELSDCAARPAHRGADPHLRPPGVRAAPRRSRTPRWPLDRRRRRGDRRLHRIPPGRRTDPAAGLTPTLTTQRQGRKTKTWQS